MSRLDSIAKPKNHGSRPMLGEWDLIGYTGNTKSVVFIGKLTVLDCGE